MEHVTRRTLDIGHLETAVAGHYQLPVTSYQLQCFKFARPTQAAAPVSAATKLFSMAKPPTAARMLPQSPAEVSTSAIVTPHWEK